MSTKGVRTATPYTARMQAAIDQLVGQDYAAFNQDQLAQAMGVKKTNSFRARLKQLVDSGYLVCWGYYTQKGGVGTAYGLASQQMALPALPF